VFWNAGIADAALMGQPADMSRFTQISEALNREGWSLMPMELASDCWWAKDIWEIRSIWTPIDATVHLSLLVDPMYETDRNNVPDTAVWAIGVSKEFPQDRQDAGQVSIPIKHRMNDAAAEIVSEAAKLRMAN